MDGRTMDKICRKVPVLSKNFLGVCTFRKLLYEKFRVSTGSYLVVNVQNVHWIVLLCTGYDQMYVFDSLEILDKQMCREIILFSFDIEEVTFLGGDGLQKRDSLTCGEHCVFFLLSEMTFYVQNKRFNAEYVKQLLEYCKKREIEPDAFVWQEIYKNLKLARVPDLHKILLWEDEYYRCFLFYSSLWGGGGPDGANASN